MRARAIIGANFGDEGKGAVTDYLCATQGAGMVVRFNGGAQAGHTVVTPNGLRHVFSHFGAGTLAGVPTFLSQFFVCNPLMFFKELEELINLRIEPEIYAHPSCNVTTFADMFINQRKEEKRGVKRHGSVGLGVHETMIRSKVPELTITMADLWNGTPIEDKLSELCGKWAEFRCGEKISHPEAMIAAFIERAKKMAEIVHPLGIGQCKDPIFEGAQGLLLDMDNKEFRPHLTHSKTGLHNVRILCAQAGITDIDAYYVSRTYLTRHGAGPLPGEDAKLKFADNTNVNHDFQGSLRFGHLDTDELAYRIADDSKGANAHLVFTHCDQLDESSAGAFYFYGPTRNDVSVPLKRKPSKTSLGS